MEGAPGVADNSLSFTANVIVKCSTSTAGESSLISVEYAYSATQKRAQIT
jgi:hypothetical protein